MPVVTYLGNTVEKRYLVISRIVRVHCQQILVLCNICITFVLYLFRLHEEKSIGVSAKLPLM
jgi:hypothetical protein